MQFFPAMGRGKSIVLGIALLFLAQSAGGCEAYRALVPSWAIGRKILVGQNFRVQLPDGSQASLNFVGKTVAPDGTPHSALLYDRKADTLHVIPWEKVLWHIEAAETPVAVETRSYAQPFRTPITETNVVFNAFLQLKHDERLGKARDGLATEQARYELLSDLFLKLNRLRMDKAESTPEKEVVSVASQFGVQAARLPTSPKLLADRIHEELEAEHPVLLTFGPELKEDGPAYAFPGVNPAPLPHWVPKENQPPSPLSKLSENAYSPLLHQVLILNAFDGPGNSRRYLVLDPNSATPLVWDEKAITNVQKGPLNAFALRGKPKQEGK